MVVCLFGDMCVFVYVCLFDVCVCVYIYVGVYVVCVVCMCVSMYVCVHMRVVCEIEVPSLKKDCECVRESVGVCVSVGVRARHVICVCDEDRELLVRAKSNKRKT
jgi:hypothetical protein